MKIQLEEWSFCTNSSDNINNSDKIEEESNSSIVVDKEEEAAKDSCGSCCLSQNLIENLIQRIEKLEFKQSVEIII